MSFTSAAFIILLIIIIKRSFCSAQTSASLVVASRTEGLTLVMELCVLEVPREKNREIEKFVGKFHFCFVVAFV